MSLPRVVMVAAIALGVPTSLMSLETDFVVDHPGSRAVTPHLSVLAPDDLPLVAESSPVPVAMAGPDAARPAQGGSPVPRRTSPRPCHGAGGAVIAPPATGSTPGGPLRGSAPVGERATLIVLGVGLLGVAHRRLPG